MNLIQGSENILLMLNTSVIKINDRNNVEAVIVLHDDILINMGKFNRAVFLFAFLTDQKKNYRSSTFPFDLELNRTNT